MNEILQGGGIQIVSLQPVNNTTEIHVEDKINGESAVGR